MIGGCETFLALKIVAMVDVYLFDEFKTLVLEEEVVFKMQERNDIYDSVMKRLEG